MLEIEITTILVIIFSCLTLILFIHPSRCIITRLNDGYHFEPKTFFNILYVLVCYGLGILTLLVVLHYSEIIKLI